MPTPRAGAFTGVIGTKIYVVGGASSNAVLNVNEIYDTVTGTWSTGAPIPTARWLGGSAVVNNIFYAIAGGTTSADVSVVEAYDPSSNTWSTKASVPMATSSVYAVTDGSIVYLVGGCCSNGRYSYLQAYNPSTDTWTVLAPMNVQKSQSALGAFGSMIVSAGGLLSNSNATTDNEGYNPSTNSWQTLAPLPDARQAGCFEAVGNVLYVAGGHNIGGGNPEATVDAYHADTNTWSTGLPLMPYAVVNVASASLGGRLYCFGGSDNGGLGNGNIFNYLQIYEPPLPLPSIGSGGVVSASAFGEFTSVSPGSWIEIYGNSLAVNTRGWSTADFNGINAPKTLDGTSVTIGGQTAFVDYISPSQVNALVPSNVPTGQQQLSVTTTAGTSVAYAITVNETQSGLLATPQFNIGGVQYAVAFHSDGTYVLPVGAIAGLTSRPAQSGETITLYGVGFGPVTPNIPAGQLVQELNMLALPLQMEIGGLPASLEYDGLAPSFTGLYQFNVTMPAAPSGNQPLTFTLNGVSGTQTLYLSVGQ
jgi:uncharacterized protein (TIGR03437 family)